MAEERAADGVAQAAWLQVCDDGARPNPAQGGAPAPVVAVDSLHLGHEIVTRVAQVHRARFGKAPAPVPFTTCYRLDLLGTCSPSF